MKFIADLHLHSHYSIATSRDLIPEHLDYWARLKGIKVVGTGDFTHPGWLAELSEKLELAEAGLFRLKDQYKNDPSLKTPHVPDQEVRFMLTAEISSIYSKGEKVRKVHHVLFAPDFETVEKIQKALSKIGNITSDGRPILGLDSRDLLEIALTCSDEIFFVPAHIWTPWFSALGAKSGFDSIEECYGDLAKHICAVETGLSSDPAMNRICSFLDKYALISNSDAHSPEKLGREANLFDTELSYRAITSALREKDHQKFLGTIEFFPQEGKYHYDGHRKCGLVWDPLETMKHNEICPVCGKKVTVGVLNRVMQLADRQNPENAEIKTPYFSLVPLKEILAEIAGTNPNTKQVSQNYKTLLNKAGSEFNVLLHRSLPELKQITNDLTVEAIRRMRAGEVYIREGYDGEYGQIKVFKEGELKESQSFLFRGAVKENIPPYDPKKRSSDMNLNDFQRLKLKSASIPGQEFEADRELGEQIISELNQDQKKALEHFKGPLLIMAGPGTGKTRVLTQRIAHLIKERGVNPRQIMAVTFTNKAAQEMKERLTSLLDKTELIEEIQVSTFHALGYRLLAEYLHSQDITKHFTIIADHDKYLIFYRHLGLDRKGADEWIERVSHFKQKSRTALSFSGEEQIVFDNYQKFLRENDLFDLDDLIFEPLQIFEKDQGFLEECRERWPWLLIDEYQDINAAQYQLIRQLAAGDNPNLCVIGDPNQAIYGFRGADIQFIQRFKNDFKEAAEYDLQKSYRCSQNILRASENVIASGQRMLQGLQKGVLITISEQSSDKSEAEYVARTIEQMMGGLRFFSMDSAISAGEQISDIQSLSEIAVLCRIKKLIPPIEKAFRDHSIPYQSLSEEPLFEREPESTVLDILKLILYPTNRYLKNKLLNQSFWLKKDRQAILEDLKKKTSVALKIQTIYEIMDPKDNSNQKVLIDLAQTFDTNLAGFIRFASLGIETDTYRKAVENVPIMTLHAAKGLEFKCVFIVGCEDGLLPYSLFERQGSDRLEERRLLYVGMTRCSKYLYLTHARRRFMMGREFRLARSPFLDQIEKELIEQSRSEYKKLQKKDDGQLSLF